MSVCGLGRGTDHSIPAPAPLTVYWLYQQRDEHSREEPERSDPVNPFMLYTHLLPPKPVPTLSRKVLKLTVLQIYRLWPASTKRMFGGSPH